MNLPSNMDVVIVNYNAGHDILNLVEELLADDYLHITVVDNASTDGSDAKLRKLPVSLIENETNKGFATACNQGAQSGNSKYIAFVNPDCQLQSADLHRISEQFAQPDVGLVGCQVVNMDGSIQRGTWRQLPNFWRVMLTLSRLEKIPSIQGLNLSKPPKIWTAVNGACYVIKREVFEQIKGFDEGFPLHFEDLDLFARVIKAGHQIQCAQAVKVKHIKGLSSKDSEQIKRWKKQGLYRYFKKHRPTWESRIIGFLTGLK